MTSERDKLYDVIDGVQPILQPPPKLTVSEWADKYARLSSESSAEPGIWITSRAEYQRGPMNAFRDPQAKQIVLMWSAQTGKTSVLLNIIAYIIDQSPGPSLFAMPNDGLAEAFSKERVDPMLRDTEQLHKKLILRDGRKGRDAILQKQFIAGFLSLTGANSTVSLSSRPIKYLLADEVDKWKPTKEGDPYLQAKKRTQTFTDSKEIACSTPTIKGLSRIEGMYEASNKQRYYVPCPKCGEFQLLEFSRLKWDKDSDGLPVNVRYICEHCQTELTEGDKLRMVGRGKWIAEKPHITDIIGFHINELYSPFSTWKDMATDFVRAKENPEKLQVFLNTSLAETWEHKQTVISESELAGRLEPFDKIPNDVYLLTAGIDVQKNRLHIQVIGWGMKEEAWIIDYAVLQGNPESWELWDQLDEYLAKGFTRVDGRQLHITAKAIDTGGLTTRAVYDYVRDRQHSRVYGVKGIGGHGRPYIGRVSTSNRGGVALYPLGVDSIKQTIYQRLEIEREGQAYIHFREGVCNDEYFKELTAEYQKTVFTNGQPRIVWEKRAGRNNEALDTFVYGLAAYHILQPDMPGIKERIQSGRKRKDPVREQVRAHNQMRSNWINSWNS